MPFHHYDSLWVFQRVARHASFAAAAAELNMTKGAVSYQIKTLEHALGFSVFHRLPRGVALTHEGQELLETATQAFQSVENKVQSLRSMDDKTVTVGLSSYLASRWLSPRLMDFMRTFPDIRLRLQPMIDLMDLEREDVDLVVRWGDGQWNDLHIERLFNCPAFPTGSVSAMQVVEEQGLAVAFESLRLLNDRTDSGAWKDWFTTAGLTYVSRPGVLTIPDPNVRVQAVIDGQGVALNDVFVSEELQDGRMLRLSDVQLEHYGYFLAYRPEGLDKPGVRAFVNWLREQAAGTGPGV